MCENVALSVGIQPPHTQLFERYPPKCFIFASNVLFQTPEPRLFSKPSLSYELFRRRFDRRPLLRKGLSAAFEPGSRTTWFTHDNQASRYWKWSTEELELHRKTTSGLLSHCLGGIQARLPFLGGITLILQNGCSKTADFLSRESWRKTLLFSLPCLNSLMT